MQLLDTSARIMPFGDPVGAMPLFGRPFEEAQREAVSRSGVEAGRLSLADRAYASDELLSDFARRAPGGRPSRLTVPRDSSLACLCPVSSMEEKDGALALDVFLDAPPGASLEELRLVATPVLVDGPRNTWKKELPRLGPGPHALQLPADGRLAFHVEHWVHVLWAWPLLLPLMRASFSEIGKVWRRMRGGNLVGRNVDIHPSAHVEGSILADGVEIGAKATVHDSYIGPRSKLSDFARVSRSVFEEDTHVLADGCFIDVVALGGGTLASLLLRDTVLGKKVFLTSGVIFWTDAIEETIHVEHRGERVDTGRRVLGGCAGHGAILGARTIVAPGRALPNRVTVVMRKEEGVHAVRPGAPPEPLAWNDGALVPVRDFAPGYRPEELET